SFVHDTATPYLYALSLHDALPISIHRLDRRMRMVLWDMIYTKRLSRCLQAQRAYLRSRQLRTTQMYKYMLPKRNRYKGRLPSRSIITVWRSEEHTSELQSRENLVCRLLLEKKNAGGNKRTHSAGAGAGRS